jgi:MFS family permease
MPAQDLRLRVTLSLALVVVLTIVAFSAVSFRAFDLAVEPELRQRTEIFGTMLQEDLQHALDLGIPIDAIGGLDKKAAEIVADFPEVQRVRIVSQEGNVLLDMNGTGPGIGLKGGMGLEAWHATFPVLSGSKIAAVIELTGNPRIIEAHLLRVLIDIGVLALAIILLGVEVILALAARTIWRPREAIARLLEDQRLGRFDRVISIPRQSPLAQLGERLNDRAVHLSAPGKPAKLEVSLPVTARLPVFLLALGTETTASFLPIMARNAERMEAIPAAAAAATPLVLYLLMAAAASPVAGHLVRRVGAQTAFSWSLPPILAGLVVMAASPNLFGIALGRMALAAGYTLALVACSSYMLRASGRDNATQLQASLNIALFGGVLAGSVIGGIAAYKTGYTVAILLGAVAMLVASLVARWGLSGPAGAPGAPRPVARENPGNGRVFTGLVVGLAMPASATTAIVIWYLVPLLLAKDGFDTGMIARILMLYYLAAILVAPLAGQISLALGISDGIAAGLGAALATGALFGAGLFELTPIALVAILGVGHAILRAPLYAQVVQTASERPEWIGHFRMAERLGAAAALVFAIVTVGGDEPGSIFVGLAGLSLSGMIIFGIARCVKPTKGGSTT